MTYNVGNALIEALGFKAGQEIIVDLDGRPEQDNYQGGTLDAIIVGPTGPLAVRINQLCEHGGTPVVIPWGAIKVLSPIIEHDLEEEA